MLTMEKILENVFQTGDAHDYFVEDGILFHRLETMPYDRFDINGRSHHATGWEYWDEERQAWKVEYEE